MRAWFALWIKRLLRFSRLTPAERRLLVEAAVGLTLASASVRTFGFRRTARRLGRHMAESPHDGDNAVMETAGRVRWAIESAARVLPWHPVCLPQAIAAKAMLDRRRIESTIYLGVDASQDLDAHAWVRVADVIVTGGPRDERFSVVSTFA